MKRSLFVFFSIILCISLGIFGFNIKQKLSRINAKTRASSEKLERIENFLYLPLNEILVSHLKVYDVKDENGPIELIRHGKNNDGGYIVATKSLNQADILLGYGIADDNSFENDFSLKYNKPSFGFDCGVSNSEGKSKLFTFISECIDSDSSLYGNQKSSNNVSSFSSQIEKLKLQDKKLFIKMDIEGAEYEAFKDILKYSKNITGITLEIHLGDGVIIQKAINLLKKLSDDFILIHVHGNNGGKAYFTTTNLLGVLPNIFQVTFINKSLITSSTLSENQSHPREIDQPDNPNKSDLKFKILN